MCVVKSSRVTDRRRYGAVAPSRETEYSTLDINSSSAGWPVATTAIARWSAGTISPACSTRSNGHYDFTKFPQRGIGEASEYVGRWDATKDTWIGVSNAGGAPIRT